MTEKTGAEERNGVLKEKMLGWLPEQSRLETAIPGSPPSRYDAESSAASRGCPKERAILACLYATGVDKSHRRTARKPERRGTPFPCFPPPFP